MFRLRSRLNSSFVVFASSLFFHRSSKESKPVPIDNPVEIPPFTPYQHVNCTGFECIREASMISLSAASSFLKQTLYYYSELTQRYCDNILIMIELLEQYKKLAGHELAQQEIWDIYVKHRGSHNEMRSELLRLRLLLSTIDRLLHESIEASYQTQDEVVTQLVSHELMNSKIIIEKNEQLISKNELDLTSEQVKIIETHRDNKHENDSKE